MTLHHVFIKRHFNTAKTSIERTIKKLYNNGITHIRQPMTLLKTLPDPLGSHDFQVGKCCSKQPGEDLLISRIMPHTFHGETPDGRLMERRLAIRQHVHLILKYHMAPFGSKIQPTIKYKRLSCYNEIPSAKRNKCTNVHDCNQLRFSKNIRVNLSW